MHGLSFGRLPFYGLVDPQKPDRYAAAVVEETVPDYQPIRRVLHALGWVEDTFPKQLPEDEKGYPLRRIAELIDKSRLTQKS